MITGLQGFVLMSHAQKKMIPQKSKDPLPVITMLPDSYSKRSLEEIENPYALEEGTNTRKEYSVLAKDTGYLNIGAYRIRINGFSRMDYQEAKSKLRFPDSLRFVAVVHTQNGEPTDTIILKGIKPSSALISRLNQKPPDVDPYAWQQLNRTMGFGNDCPPGECRRHFIAITASGRLIRVNDPQEMTKIMPRIQSATDALFHVVKKNELPTAKTARVSDGFLVIINEKISDCPINFADVLYKVSFTGKTERMGMVITKRTTLCH